VKAANKWPNRSAITNPTSTVLRFSDTRRPPIGELVILLVDLGKAVEEMERLYGRTSG